MKESRTRREQARRARCARSGAAQQSSQPASAPFPLLCLRWRCLLLQSHFCFKVVRSLVCGVFHHDFLWVFHVCVGEIKLELI